MISIKELDKKIKELEEQKQSLLFKQERENYINSKEKEKISAIVSYRSTEERELAYDKYEHLLKLFNYFFDGIATEEQLYKLYSYSIKDFSEVDIKQLLNAFKIYGLSRVQTNSKGENLYLITTFSVVRIYGNKNLRGVVRIADSTLKKKLAKNDYILWLIKNINNENIKEPQYRSEQQLQIDTKLSDTIKQKDIDYLSEKYQKVDFSFLSKFDNNKAFIFIKNHTNLTTEDSTYLLNKIINNFKKNNNSFYYTRLLEQICLVSKKKQLMDPDIKEKDILRAEIKEGRVFEKILSSFDRPSYLTLIDLESRNVFIRSFYIENDLLHIDLDILEVGATLRTTEMEYLLLDINNTISSIFGEGENETYFVNIHWHLKKSPDYSLYKKRVKELAQGRGNKKAIKNINNIFIADEKEVFNQNIKPLNIKEYTKKPAKPKEEFKDELEVKLPHKGILRDITPITPQKPQNNSNKDKPTPDVKTPQNKDFNLDREIRRQEMLEQMKTKQTEGHY